MTNLVKTGAARDETPRIERDAALIASFLSDAAHVSGGSSAGVAFPANAAQVAAVVRNAASVLAIGAQSSLTGGATPRGEVVLSTRSLNHLDPLHEGTIRVGAGVPLAMMQPSLGVFDRWYPPAPTFDGASAGGTISTNAAGAATFKYGSTRAWVDAITVVLADGSVLDVRRGDCVAAQGVFEIERADGSITRVPVPTYQMPGTAKLSAGYFARPDMDLIDLFVGSEGTLGIVTAAILRTRPRPRRAFALIACASDAQAVEVTAALREAAHQAWRGDGPLDVAAIEYMDAASLGFAGTGALARAGVSATTADGALLLVQLEIEALDAALEALQTLLDRCRVHADPLVTTPGDDRAAQQLFDLREAVPAGVNAAIAAAKARAGDGIEKTAGDMIVPFDRLGESIDLYRRVCAAHGVHCAIWGHASDGNLHPNVIPSSLGDVARGRDALLEIAREVMKMGGAPLAEHGVGRSALKQRMLVELYGEDGIAQMRAVKRALDPDWKLAPGVIFPRV